MIFKRMIISAGTLAAGMFILTASVSAQDTKTTADTTERPAQAERRERPFGKRPGFREFGGRGGHHRRLHHGGRAFLRGLDLTEAQRTQIRGILEANRPDRERMEAIRPLIDAKRNGTITTAQQEQLDTFRTSAREKARSLKQQIESILTPEQKAQIEQRKQEMKTRMEERRRLREERQKDRPTETTKPVQ